MKIDFGNMEDFSPVEPGFYRARITNLEFKIQDPPKYDYLKVEWTLEDIKGKKTVQGNMSFAPRALFRLKKMLETVFDEKIDIEEYDLDLKQLLGSKALLQISTNKYTDNSGKEQLGNQITDFYNYHMEVPTGPFAEAKEEELPF